MDPRDLINKDQDKSFWKKEYERRVKGQEANIWSEINSIYKSYKSLIGKADVSESLCILSKRAHNILKHIENLLDIVKVTDAPSSFGHDDIVAFLQDHDVTTTDTVKSHIFIAKELIEKIRDSLIQDIRKVNKNVGIS